MELFQQPGMSFGRDDVGIHFVSISLPRMVAGVLRRG
jgi:hypothetical protein